jgi:hypothetical protein
MQENVRREIIKQLRDIREVMHVHSKAHRGHKAAIHRLIAKFDSAQKVVAAIRKETDTAKLESWVLKGKTMNLGSLPEGLGVLK